MSEVALTGNDDIELDGRKMRDLGDGDVAKLVFDADLVAVKTGKNGNTIYAGNAMGQQGKLTFRVLRGSPDDQYFAQRLSDQRNDLPSFELMDGFFTKRVGQGDGSVINDTYLASGGVFTKIPEVGENVEGGTDPALAIYSVTFGNVKRAAL